MWLPDPIYRRAPYYWMLLGVLFVAVGTYRALQGDALTAWICLVSGIANCFWSLRVALRRRTRREERADDLELDQTCELSYRPESTSS